MKKILYFLIIPIAILTACQKTKLADNVSTGEGLVQFSLKTPTSGTNVIMNSATPNSVIQFTWTPSVPGVKTQPSYRWVAALKATGIDQVILDLVADKASKGTSLTLTYKQLDDLLKIRGIPAGAKVDLVWSVIADNGSTQLRSSDVFNFSVTTFKDGASPFVLLGPSSGTTPLTISPNSTTDSLKFNWTKSLPGGTGTVNYNVFFYKDDASTVPLFSIASGKSGTDTLLSISYKDFSDSLTKYGYTNLSTVAQLKWNVTATSGTWIQKSDFTNQFYVNREVNLFLVGGDSPIGWTPTNALQFIQDQSRAGVYYIYTYLTTGNNGFKFLSMKADWSAAGQKIYGEVNGADGSGNNPGNNTSVLDVSGGGGQNIATPNGPGVYRITVDLTNKKYYVQSNFGRMGFVGAGTSVGWTPSAVFPAQQMGFLSTNLFLGIVNLTQGGEYKMLDGNDWPNGNEDYTRDYEDAGNGKLNENGGPNFVWNNATGPARIIWDYRDVKNPAYMVTSASEMRVVGDGISGVNAWDPAASPTMTYNGNGQWSITLNLIGGKDIKFLAGNAWGAFDYEDNSGGSTATGTPRSIRWDGSDNFKTPLTSGSYTITLDEYKGTVTIN